jgi:hypothetical protein
MRKLRHPLSGAIYEQDEGGVVRVEQDGRVGWFLADGTWQRGELRIADPQLCGWVGGRQLPGGLPGTTPRTQQR